MQQVSLISLSLPGWLQSNEDKLEKCWLSGMTFEELLVETDDSTMVQAGSELTLIFFIYIGGIKRRCQETVKVDHVSGHTAGLRFLYFNNEHSCNIEKLIHLSIDVCCR